MINITIGGVYHDKVFGADTPGPIWKDVMAGALAGTPSQGLPTVPIGNPTPAPGSTTPAPGSTTPPGSTTGGNGGNGGYPVPWPTFSLPPGIIGGNANGGQRG